MRHSALSAVIRSRYPLAVVAGLLLAASFPKIGVAGLAWIAPALVLLAALGKQGWESFRIGYVAGLSCWLGSLYWLLLIPFTWHGIPFGPALGWLALSGMVALYPATWVWLMAAVRRPRSTVYGPQSTVHSPQSAVYGLPPAWLPREFSGLLARSWTERTLWALSGAAVWVALEMVMARMFSGFPWNLLGHSQYRLVPLIQIASVTGVYGVSFLLVWTSLSLLSAGLMVVLRPRLRSIWVAEVLLPTVVVMLAFNIGFRLVRGEAPAARTLKVTLVQPSIPQTLIWDTSRDLERFRDFIHLSEQALTNRTDLLIWPESAVPSYARWDTNIYPAITNLVRQHHVWLILGSDDLGVPAHRTRADEYEYYNASFLVSPEGHFVTRYVKRQLVVFGEYVPLVHWFPFLKWFTPIEGGFTPGTHAAAFALTNLDVKTSPLICFEDMFPLLARNAVEDDTDFLVNLTNDGWFGESAEQWQQAAAALFRTVENGLPLIRCCNNGLTCWIDAHGRLRQIFYDNRGTVYGPGFMTIEVPLLAPGQERPPTFYHRHGDLFGWVCVAVASVVLTRRIGVWRRRVRRRE